MESSKQNQQVAIDNNSNIPQLLTIYLGSSDPRSKQTLLLGAWSERCSDANLLLLAPYLSTNRPARFISKISPIDNHNKLEINSVMPLPSITLFRLTGLYSMSLNQGCHVCFDYTSHTGPCPLSSVE